jgi:general secretion pathway protein D
MAQAQNKGKILSQPKLMTLSGNEARIHIGTRYPYKASTTLNQSGGTAENIQYVDVGILLNVTPQVNTKSKTIVMKLSPEVSDVVGFRNDAPIITSRQTNTVVEVADGETVVIGGLLRDEDLKSKNGVPILREIPVIGEFFKYSNKSKNKTNLVIMITPRVVNVKGEDLKKLEENAARQESAKSPSEYQTLLEQLKKKLENKSSNK